MGVNLSIKDVPEEQVERLRASAKANHRSLQGVLRAIVDEVTRPSGKKPLNEIVGRLQKLNFTHAEESTQWIREDLLQAFANFAAFGIRETVVDFADAIQPRRPRGYRFTMRAISAGARKGALNASSFALRQLG